MGKGQARKVCVGVWETYTHTHTNRQEKKKTQREGRLIFSKLSLGKTWDIMRDYIAPLKQRMLLC